MKVTSFVWGVDVKPRMRAEMFARRGNPDDNIVELALRGEPMLEDKRLFEAGMRTTAERRVDSSDRASRETRRARHGDRIELRVAQAPSRTPKGAQ